MWNSAITAYLHYLGFMLSVGALSIEHFAVKEQPTLKESKRIVIADVVYGLGALTVLVTGVLRVLYFGKGTEYYTSNPIFWIKVGLFLFIGALSLYPTVTFILWARDLQQGQAPVLTEQKTKIITSIVRFELFGFLLLPLLAAMMARGIRLF
ncbi:MAG: DUF2214 family protein [Cyanobacteria bacterium SID2]|nr:DUF2214 family protein [Cyanobacteria bacterium SID2]MBP0006583.1 DUF2214 family protein [Cyanobacteria bacterium SBC]